MYRVYWAGFPTVAAAGFTISLCPKPGICTSSKSSSFSCGDISSRGIRVATCGGVSALGSAVVSCTGLPAPVDVVPDAAVFVRLSENRGARVEKNDPTL